MRLQLHKKLIFSIGKKEKQGFLKKKKSDTQIPHK